jgi:hypothetical protein
MAIDAASSAAFVQGSGVDATTLLAVAGFLWLGWMALADLNQVRTGRKE